MQNTVVFIDLETGGTDIHRSPIIQIAAIAVSADQITDQLEIKVCFDESQADPEALRLNSYEREEWQKCAIAPAMARGKLCAFLKKHATVQMVSQRTGNPYMVAQLAGHNAAAFDGPMLQAWFKAANEFFPASYRILDTLQLAMWTFHGIADGPKDFKLTTVAEYLGIAVENAHDALADVRMSHRIAQELQRTNALSA